MVERTSWVDCPTHGPQEPYRQRNRGLPFIVSTKARVSYALCPACTSPIIGPFDLLHTVEERHAWWATPGNLDAWKALKARPLPLRVITMRKPKLHGEAPRCGGACINGKTSCDCRCNGRCHGAGQCFCDTPTPANRGMFGLGIIPDHVLNR